MARSPARRRRDAGFTIVEVMVAMMILLVGVLGTVTLIDGANARTLNTRQREGATNLAREIVDSARSVDYDKLVTGQVEPALQTLSSLADDDAGKGGWQVVRRGTTYSVSVASCIFDDAKDKVASLSPPPGYCTIHGNPTTGDPNGDDYRKLDVTVRWKTSRAVRLTANITNPSGGFGPRIINWTPNTTTSVGPGVGLQHFTVTTALASALRWSVDDGRSNGEISEPSGATSFDFDWNLGAQTVPECGVAVPTTTVLDGTYVVSFQAFDSIGVPGDLRSQVINVNRVEPGTPCGASGGHNGSLVDIAWAPNFERDVAGYHVYRVDASSDALVCTVATTSCVDPNPPDTSGPLDYYVKAYELGTGTEGAKTDIHIDAVSGAAPDTPTGLVVVAQSDGKPKLDWDDPSGAGTPPAFYRIYRDGVAYTGRIARTSGITPTDWSDPEPLNGAHTYRVSAVGADFQESPLTAGVTFSYTAP
jgi:prepilin-type N-terminal cleavage/methylation domain-containing protein